MSLWFTTSCFLLFTEIFSIVFVTKSSDSRWSVTELRIRRKSRKCSEIIITRRKSIQPEAILHHVRYKMLKFVIFEFIVANKIKKSWNAFDLDFSSRNCGYRKRSQLSIHIRSIHVENLCPRVWKWPNSKYYAFESIHFLKQQIIIYR